MVSAITEIALLVSTYLLNLPFGYWRRNTRKFSKDWALAIHAPVPVVFLMRVLAGVPLSHIPLFVIAFFLGQFSGGRIRIKLIERFGEEFQLSNCMVIDFIKLIRNIW